MSMPDRPGLSYHIARLLSEQEFNHVALPPTHLVAATVLAKYTHSGDERANRAFKEHITQIDPSALSRVDLETRHSLNLLLYCATLTPALVAPATGATSLMKATRLPTELSSVYQLGKVVADHGDSLGRSVPFDKRLINAVLSQETWMQDFSAVQARAKDWLSRAD